MTIKIKYLVLIILIFLLFPINTYTIELFPNDIPQNPTINNITITREVPEPTQSTPNIPINPKSPQPPKPKPIKKEENPEKKPEKLTKEPAQEKTIRKLSLNLGSLLLRGDIQLGYEVPLNTEWSGLTAIYVNPDPSLNDLKRKYALLGGGKYYLGQSRNNYFLALLAGLEWLENDALALGIQIGAGYSFQWQKNVAFDLGLFANRIYHEAIKDINVYGLAAISIDIGN